MPNRANVYVDGLNFYYGIKALRHTGLLWIDLVGVIKDQIQPPEILHRIKYFNTTPTDNPQKMARHKKWLKVLSCLSFPVETFEGRYSYPKWQCSFCHNPLVCRNCNKPFNKPSEKRTDVNIAVHLMCDAFNDDFDIAYIISRDADFIPALEAVKRYHSQKKIVVIIPPGRFLHEIAQKCDGIRQLKLRHLIPHRLDNPFITASGMKIYMPKEWN